MPKLSRDQFARRVIEMVRTKFPLAKIARGEEPFSMRLNGRVASLESLYRMTLLKPDDMKHQVERWAVELIRIAEGTPDENAPWAELRERVMPILIPHEAEDVWAQGLVANPLVAGLSVGYVVDGDRTIAHIPSSQLRRWKIDADDLHEAALENLSGRSEQLAAHAATDDDGDVRLMLFQNDDGYDSSRLLLPSLHGRLREHVGSPFVAAVPTRDLLICFRDDAFTVASVQEQVKDDYRTRPHQITDKLILVTADGLARYYPKP